MGDEEIEVDHRCQFIQGVERDTVFKIQRFLHERNILVKTFKTALENLPEEDYKVVIHADRTPRGEHERRYNAPLINEIAAVISGDQFSSRDIVLRARDVTLQRVADTHKFYDALQYPLIYCKGQEGYHFQIPLINLVTKEPTPNKKVSCMDFYAYHMMLRENDFNLLARLRKDKNIAVAVASDGVAATLLSGGRTAHSVLKLPLNLALEESPICNFSKNSVRGIMLRQCKLLVWDESTMSHKKAVEALNRTLQDLRSNTDVMGGMVVLLAGDFRQTLPVIQKGTPADEIKACLKSSIL
ncbi:unnamed protein product [Parnassius mnemosyne]|uniref:ATP-dependent DNA helicase n=1 Tax=Parnassius mnemosyne TaxID=213953 RepID=A0AAV1L2R0_9NEOP